MKKINSFFHISLDGFVAGPNGEMDWITVNDEIFDHVEERIQQTDTAVYGRVTFQMMESYWPTAADKPNPSKHDLVHSKWYKNAKKIVLSTTMDAAGLKNTTIINKDLKNQIQAIKNGPIGSDDLLVFGSPTATHALIKEGLVDGYWLFVNPIILGEGIPLFKENKDRTKLNLRSAHSFACGVTALDFEVKKD